MVKFEDDKEKDFWKDAAKAALSRENRNAMQATKEADLLLLALQERTEMSKRLTPRPRNTDY